MADKQDALEEVHTIRMDVLKALETIRLNSEGDELKSLDKVAGEIEHIEKDMENFVGKFNRKKIFFKGEYMGTFDKAEEAKIIKAVKACMGFIDTFRIHLSDYRRSLQGHEQGKEAVNPEIAKNNFKKTTKLVESEVAGRLDNILERS